MRRTPLVALVAGLTLEGGALSGLALLGDAGARLPAALFLFAIAAAGFLLALQAGRRVRIGVGAILAGALLLRAPLVPVAPSLSDDVWRYLHDGRAQIAGSSPYAYAPADPATIPFRGPSHNRINHPELVTLYPPLAQVAFLAAAGLGGTLLGWKLVLLATEALLIVLIARLLRDRHLDPGRAAIYAWNPLVIVEVAAGAHLEPIAIAPLLAALVLANARRPFGAGAALGLSVAAKYFALPLAPFLARDRLPRVLAGMVLAIGLVTLPYVIAGPSVFGSLFVFGRTWSSNAGPFAALALLPGAWTGRLVAAALLCGILVLLWRRGTAATEAAFAFFLATLLLSPVVHPWYLLWIVALVPVASVPPTVRLAVLAWSLTAPAAWLAIPTFRATGEWTVPPSARLLQYGPVLLLLAWAALTRRRDAARSATSFAVPAE